MYFFVSGGGLSAPGATTTAAATAAEELPATANPPPHHAQGFNIPFGRPSIRFINICAEQPLPQMLMLQHHPHPQAARARRVLAERSSEGLML